MNQRRSSFWYGTGLLAGMLGIASGATAGEFSPALFIQLGQHKLIDLARPSPPANPSSLPLQVTQGQLPMPASCAHETPLGEIAYIDDGDLASEAIRIAKDSRRVQRKGKTLRIVPENGAPLVFTDWDKAETAGSEGDFSHFRFVGPLASTGYWQVEVQYGHDSPGAYLINPRSGDLVYLHNGEQIAALDEAHRRVITYERNNAPWRLSVVDLAETAPQLSLDCQFETPDPAAWKPRFCRMVADGGFELRFADSRRKGSSIAQFHFTPADTGWEVATNATEVQALCYESEVP